MERALDVAGLRPGESFVDLGCGDGRVLVAAGRRGARPRGVECDPELVEQARKRLAEAGIDGVVECEDIFATSLDGDVIFTYLAPATLQRLVPRLSSAAAGARLVTLDFEVPGLMPDEARGAVHLYRLPATRRQRPLHRGWGSAGVLVAATAGYESLTTFELAHPGGPVAIAASGALAEVGAFCWGVDRADPGEVVAVDARWDEHPAGTVAAGVLRASGVRSLQVFVVFVDAEEGVWELSPDACVRLRRWSRTPARDATAEELLAVACAFGEDLP